MPHTRMEIRAGADETFAALTEAELYADWIVGSHRVRRVERDWPAPGSGFHHTVGTRVLGLADRTAVEEIGPGRRLVLTAQALPVGRARVELWVEEHAEGCTVHFDERPLSGPVRLVPAIAREPLTAVRNVVSLARLRRLVEARSG
jgi:uncharacterized protein YndB with AHSA1/START domain